MVKILVHETVSLPQQLRDLERRALAVLGHELLRASSAAALVELGRSLVENARQIQAIRAASSAVAQPSAAPGRCLADLIRHSHGLLDEISDQIALCESTARQASIVMESARRLVAQERPRYPDLFVLFGRIFDEVRPLPTFSGMLPVSGLCLPSLVNAHCNQPDAGLFVEGLTAARALIWVLHDDRSEAARLPRLVLAALFQDIGRLFILSNRPSRRLLPARRAQWLERHHPALGAAVLGTIRGAPTGLALAVGQHHERLDGGGYPRALVARNMAAEAATLAAAGRFARLCLETERELTVSSAGDSRLAGSAQVLLAEAKRGMWPVAFADRLVRRIAASDCAEAQRAAANVRLPCIEDGLGREVAGFSTTATRDRHLQLHGADDRLQGLHADPEGRFAASTLDEIRGLSRTSSGAGPSDSRAAGGG